MKSVEARIDFYRDLIKIFAAYIFAIGGGIVGLLFKESSTLKYLLFASGVILEICLLIAVVRLYLSIEKLIKELKDEGV